MLRQLLAFECRQRLRQPALLIIASSCLAFGLTIGLDDIGKDIGPGMAALRIDAAYRLTFFIALSSSLAVFVAMLFCSHDALRDEDHRFEGLIARRAPLARWSSRLLTTQITVLGLISMISLGMLIGLSMPHDSGRPLLEGPLQHTLWAWLLYALPNSLICSTLLFWVSLRWRRSIVTYAAALALFLLFWLTLGLSGASVLGGTTMARTETLSVLGLIDPFAIMVFFEQTQFWTPLQRATQPLPLDTAWLLNRGLWLSFSALVCWRLQRMITADGRCDRETGTNRPAPHASTNHSDRSPELTLPGPGCAPASHEAPAMSLARNRLTNPLPGFGSQLWHQLSLLYRWPMALLMLIWIGLVVVGILMTTGFFGGIEHGGRYPTTSLLISYCAEPLVGFATALLVLFSSELLWVEKRHRIDALVDSTAVSNGCLFAAKLVCLWSIPLLIITLMIVTAAGFQLAVGFTRLEAGHYLSLYYYFGLPLMLQAVSLFFAQVLWAGSRWANRYSSWVIGSAVAMGSLVLLPRIASEYPLLLINQFPSLLRIHSELAQYGAYAQRFDRLAVYWSAVALVLAIVSMGLWKRGDWHEPRRLSSRAFRLLAPCLLLMGLCGFWLQLQLPDTHDYQADAARWQAQARYEHAYAAFRSKPVPQIDATRTRVDIDPQRQRVDFEAHNEISNPNPVALAQVLLTSRKPLASVVIDGAELVSQAQGQGWNTYLFRFLVPLAPGAQTRLHYRLVHASHPFAIDSGLVGNGSYFHQGQFEPSLGYVEALEIVDAELRRQHHLPPRPSRSRELAHGGGDEHLQAVKRRFEAIVSTSLEQTAVTSGELVREWKEERRRYFHYRSTSPIPPWVGYFSATYERRRFDHRGIPIEFYVHPAHAHNIGAMLEATRATLDYCEKWFEAYPYPGLRVVQVPSYHPFGGRASAGVVALNEGLFVKNLDAPSLINHVQRNTIHEVAHQWWGERLTPRKAAGSQVISESLAKYVEAEVLGELQGTVMQSHLNDYNRRRYFSGRAVAAEPEVALAEAEQAYLSYGKGPVVLLALRELLGEQRLNATLRRFMRDHGDTAKATTAELIGALTHEASPQEADLIRDWMSAVIEYRLSLENAVVERLGPGRYSVQVDLIAERQAFDVDGRAIRVPLDEPITLVLRGGHAANAELPVAERQVTVRSRRTRVTLVSEVPPAYVVVDPRGTRIEADIKDNVLPLAP